MPYAFHDFKKQGVDETLLRAWLKHVPLATLLNKKGTTYRALSDADKAQCRVRNRRHRADANQSRP